MIITLINNVSAHDRNEYEGTIIWHLRRNDGYMTFADLHNMVGSSHYTFKRAIESLSSQGTITTNTSK